MKEVKLLVGTRCQLSKGTDTDAGVVSNGRSPGAYISEEDQCHILQSRANAPENRARGRKTMEVTATALADLV